MTTFLLIAVLLAIAWFFYVSNKKAATSNRPLTDEPDEDSASVQPAQYKAKALLTPNGKEFFERLVQALPGSRILTQVALGALLQPDVKNDNKQFYRVRGTFAQKIADYVVCDAEMNVLAIVELDDRTHRDDRDARRDAMLQQAGYKILRWNSKGKPTVEQIRETFQTVPF
jgi:hypothetical protein